ncbi:MAG: YihY/virulence factor BrkB family protein [Solirubrobacteraceae bacterium]
MGAAPPCPSPGGAERSAGAGARLTRRARNVLSRFWALAWSSNITGQAAMIAYNMLFAVLPVALLGLFIAGQVLSSHEIQTSVLSDLREVFPGTTKSTLSSVLREVQSSTTSTGLLALFVSLWLAASFWGALDTAFSRIYGCESRRWLEQKRFGFVMVGVLLMFMGATVALPTVQSFLAAGARRLPLDLAHVTNLVYAISLAISIALLFFCLAVIYSRVPNRRPVPWRGVWPGALAATFAIGLVDYAFPLYLTSISTIARFGTTIVFILIVLGWFYVVSLIILGGAVLNALRLPPVRISE